MPTDQVCLWSDTIIEYINNNQVPLIILKLYGWVRQASRRWSGQHNNWYPWYVCVVPIEVNMCTCIQVHVRWYSVCMAKVCELTLRTRVYAVTCTDPLCGGSVCVAMLCGRIRLHQCWNQIGQRWKQR